MSSVYKNGEWWYYRNELREPNGKVVRVQRSLKTKDKKTGIQRQREYDKKYLTQQIHLGNRTDFKTIVQEFHSHRRTLLERGELTQNTIRSDIGSIKVFVVFFEEKKLKYLNEFEDPNRSRELLEDFISTRLKKKISPNTIRRDLRHLSGFFSYCVSPPRRLLHSNPVSEVSLPKPTRQLKFPDQKEWLILREYLRQQYNTGNLTLQEMVVWFQIETGCRVGEVFRLKWERSPTDVVGLGESWSVIENDFSVIRMYSKRRERVIPISSLSDGQLSRFLRSRQKKIRGTYVFPSPVTQRPLNLSQFGRWFGNLLNTLEIKKKFGTHGIRHGFISYVLNSGISSDQLGWLVGHSSSEITRLYSHIDLETQSRVFSVLK